jgi:hypothetical protein
MTRVTRGEPLFHAEEGHHVVHLAFTRVEATLRMGLSAEASRANATERSDRSSACDASGFRDDLAVGHLAIVSQKVEYGIRLSFRAQKMHRPFDSALTLFALRSG